MKKIFPILLLMSVGIHFANAQSSVAIGDSNPKASAVLYLKGNGSQGLIIPIVSNTTSIANPESGMIVYNSTDKKVYYHDGTAWTAIGSGTGGTDSQDLTLNVTTNVLGLTNDATTVDLTPYKQTLAIAGSSLSISGGNSVTLPGTTYTAGTGISITGTTIANTGDNNAADDLTTTSTAAGDVTGLFSNLQIASGAVTTTEIADGTITATDLGAMSASNGQILKYNGTAWVPSPDDVGGGATPTLTNGQILIGNGTSNSASTLTGDAALASGALTISNNAITSAKIADGTIVAGDLNSMSATNGQVLKFNGTNWAPAAETGTTYTAGTGISVVGAVITNTGDANAADDLTTTSTATGDVTGLFSNLQIASGAVTTTEIADGTIAAGDLNSMSATNGQVLKFNGTNWAPAAETGTTYTAGTGISVVGTVIANTGDANAADDLTTTSTATGDVTGLFSNLQIASGAVTTTEIADGTIAAADLSTMTATTGQILKFNGTIWAPAPDDVGGGATPTLSNGQILTGDGTNNAASTVSGDAVLSGGVLTISNNAVTSAKIADGTIAGADLAPAIAISTTGNIAVSGAGTLSGNGSGLTALNATNVTSGALDLARITAGTNGNVLTTVAGVPTWQAPLTGATTLDGLTDATVTTPSTGQVLINDGAGQFRNVSMSGDATINATGLVSLTAGSVSGGTGGKIVDASITSSDLANGSVSGGIGGVIADASITDADIASLDAAKITTGILPVSVGGTGRNTWDGLLIGSGATINDISNGTVGQVLTIVGTSPSWQTPASSGWGLTGNATTNPATNYVGTSDSQPLVFRTNAVEAMRVLTNGSVGIGVATPASKLDVVNATGIAIQGTTNSNAANSYAVSGVHTGTGDVAGYFIATNASGGINSHGVYGQADGAGAGVFGASNGTTGNAGRFMNMNAGNANPVVQIFNGGTGPSLTTVGAVGIATSVPVERLHVEGNMLASGTFGTGTLTAAGAGTRMFFYPGKAAFRAGQLTAVGGGEELYWNDAQIGSHSFAGGVNNLASGNNAFAMGEKNRSTGYSSVALGNNTFANQFASFAMGFTTEANGEQSAAFGRGTHADATSSFAIGRYNVGGGDPVIVNSTDPLFEVGNGASDASRSNALTVLRNGELRFAGALVPNNLPGAAGQILTSAGAGVPPIWTNPSGTTLINNSGLNNLYAGVSVSTAGQDNAFYGFEAGRVNTGNQNTIVGADAGVLKTSGDLSTFIGWYAGRTATGNSNTFIGAQAGGNVTTGNVNTFIGEKAGLAAIGATQSVLIGSQTNIGANLNNAVAIGFGAVVNTSNSMVLGNSAMQVGIRTNAPRGALEIQRGDIIMSGDAVSPNDPADLNFWTFAGAYKAKIWAEPGAFNALYFSTNTNPNNNQNLAIDPAGNVGINTISPTSMLSVNGTADKIGGGTWGTFSDRRVKKDVRSFTDGLDVLMKFKPVQFKYNGLAGYREDGKDYVGVIAQDVLPIAPYMISTVRKKLTESDQEETDILKYDASALTYVLVNSIKEQQAQIEELKKVIKILEDKLKVYQTNDGSELTAIRAEIKKLSEAIGMEANAEKKK